MNAQLAKMITEQLQKAVAELAEAKQRAEDINAKVEYLARRVERWRGALAEATGEEPAKEGRTEDAVGDAADRDVDVNKSAIARKVLQANAARGVTPKDVREAFDKAGVSYHPNYAYAVLRRFRRNKTVRVMRGRYYPAEPRAETE